MTDTKEAPHPSNITEEQREELRKSDPAAFTDDDADTPTDTAAEQAEADRLATERAEADRIAAETAEAEKQAAMIPKGRLNEVLRERDAERERADALAAEIAALKAGPKIDYDAEITALDAKWNGDDDFDGSHADYIAQRDALLVGRTEARAFEKFEQRQAEEAQQREAQQWNADAAAFVAANPIYDPNTAAFDAEEKAALEAALHGVYARYPKASNVEKLEKAHRIVEAIAVAEGRREAVAAPAAPGGGRNAVDARAAAVASAAPPVISGGVGGRGTATPNIDFERMKPGDWAKLSRADKIAALGGEEAL